MRLTSAGSRSRASCRASLTSSVQPVTSALPADQRVCPTVCQSSCLAAIVMPWTRARGIQPLVHQLGEVLARRVGGERVAKRRRVRRANAGADRLEFEAARRERPDGEPHADYAVPAELAALATIRLHRPHMCLDKVFTIGPNEP